MLKIKNPYLILFLLTAAYTLSFMDRYVMNLLLNNVKADFKLTEMQAGLLAGAGFAVLYALMTLPMGFIADRTNRTRLAALGVTLWSVMTIGCGLARNFMLLIAGRVGVGVGEAALTPAAYPVICSLFGKQKLSTALAVYSSGIYIGSGLAYWLGGKALVYIQQNNLHTQFSFIQFDWQLVFILFGLPGLLVAALLYLVAENPAEHTSATQSSLKEFWVFLKSGDYFFLWFCLASACFNVAVYAAGVWLPAYLQRVHSMSVVESGKLLGITMLFIAPVGAIAGGILSDRLSNKTGFNGRLNALLLFIAGVMFCFLFLGFGFNQGLKYLPLIGLCLLMGAPVAITAAIMQEIAPVNLRSTAPAFLLMMQNLIGMSLGPVLVAFITQYVLADDKAIGVSIAITGVVFCLVSLL